MHTEPRGVRQKSVARFGEDHVPVRSLAALDSCYRFLNVPHTKRDRSNGYVHRTARSQVKSAARFSKDYVPVRSLASLDSSYRLMGRFPIGSTTLRP